MSGTFAQNRVDSLQVFDRGPEGEAFATALGKQQDEEIRKATDAVLMRFPDRAPADALDLVGSAFRRSRSPRETNNDPAYRARIQEAWAFWESAPKLRGGFVDFLEPYWSSITSTTYPGGVYRPIWRNNWNGAIDGEQFWSSRVWGIWPGTLAADGTWGSPGTWGDGGLWGLCYDPADPYTAPSFGVADLAWVRRELRLVKGSAAYPVLLAVGTTVDAFGDSGIWGDGSLWGDGGLWGTPSPDTIRYLPIGRIWGDYNVYGGGPGLWGTPGDTWDNFV